MHFVAVVKALIEEQGTTVYVALALDELGLKYVEDVAHEDFFVRRVLALREEDK